MSDTLETRRLSGALGAEIRSVDLAKLDDALFKAIHAAFLEHHVLVFPDQRLAPEDQIAFGERFGELHIHPIVPHIEGHPPILCIPNLGKERAITENWHSDVTFEARPPMASALYALEIPPAGGDTMFANQHLAYERLSPGMQRLLEGLEAVHSAEGLARATRGRKEAEAGSIDGQRHPVVRTHPETGRKALFVNPAFVVGLADMTREESQPLLAFLYRHATSPDLTMRHVWRRGDLVIWDNRSVQHYAIHDYGDAPRTMHRVTVIGDEPR
ncbi:MAG: TauD/TfdA dioxygenase family protein [Myxococcota bacterium]